jgi:transcriptional regulator with XRE-family HTH domain
MPVGEDIKSIRQQKGMTQAQLAAAVGTTSQNISQYERGVRNPKIGTLQKIADALGENVTMFIPTQRESPAEYAALEPYLTDDQKKYLAELDEEWLSDMLDEAENTWFEQRHQMFNALFQLSDEGRIIAIERVKELTEIPRYQDKDRKEIVEEQEKKMEDMKKRHDEEMEESLEKIRARQAAKKETGATVGEE